MKNQRLKYNYGEAKNVFLNQFPLKHIIVNLVQRAYIFSDSECRIEIDSSNIEHANGVLVKDFCTRIIKEDQQYFTELLFYESNAGTIPGMGLHPHVEGNY